MGLVDLSWDFWIKKIVLSVEWNDLLKVYMNIKLKVRKVV